MLVFTITEAGLSHWRKM